jgi:RimJ/RimL family protein N-acetyltransferase
LAVQETYQEASKFLPSFVGMENWTIPEHQNYLAKFGSLKPDVKNFLFFYENKVIGAGHLFPSGWKDSGELIYWVRTGWDGLGVGEFIARTMAASAGSYFGFKWIVIQTDRNNVASKRVAEKSGGTVVLIYGYYNHFGKQSNMIVWAIPTPFRKNFKYVF